ncbi:MAG: ribosome assembly RNA-binding protein YhbY [Clostridium sp.]|uniref:ribosome assembly RNA-binding protein YhbY n=1 Tax=Clostridium sp. TaxID=1506 RepID=UPI003EE6B3E3
MLKGKERAYLRKLAHGIDPIFQIGKNGIEDNFLTQIREALEARELIKIKVLENSGLDTREASDTICRAVNAEGVQSIGNKIVIYKESKKNPKIEIPKK